MKRFGYSIALIAAGYNLAIHLIYRRFGFVEEITYVPTAEKFVIAIVLCVMFVLLNVAEDDKK